MNDVATKSSGRASLGPRVLLTGRPGVGKTTVVRRVAERVERRAVGFVTEEVREAGGKRRAGFDVVTLERRRSPLARRGAPGPRVGAYGVDVKSFEGVALPALEAALEDPLALVVVDEIGKMEFASRRFVELLEGVLERPNPLLGTILQARHPVADRIRAREDIVVREVTPENRDRLPGELTERFR